MTESYIYKEQKKLRCGYTTGTCAAAAAKAAAMMLLGGKRIHRVEIRTPRGEVLQLGVQEPTPQDWVWMEKSREYKDIVRKRKVVNCGVQKDGGDDVDATNGMMVYAMVYELADEKGRRIPSTLEREIKIEGGVGIGRVTQVGLDQPVGNAAINSVPRQMIKQSVQEVMEAFDYEGGMQVLIWAPEGMEIGKKTFNERLGIQGGISILGTSGIVEPMSEKALVDTIRTEMQQKIRQGQKDLLVVPGNYGEAFLTDTLGIQVDKAIKCSNFIGETIDMAYEYRVRSILIVGHIGKLVKLGAGIMNTHSKMADGRMEVLASCGIMAEVDSAILKRVLRCRTTDEALEILEQEQVLQPTLKILMERIAFYLENRACKGMTMGAVIFSNRYGLLGMTRDATALLEKVR